MLYSCVLFKKKEYRHNYFTRRVLMIRYLLYEFKDTQYIKKKADKITLT